MPCNLLASQASRPAAEQAYHRTGPDTKNPPEHSLGAMAHHQFETDNGSRRRRAAGFRAAWPFLFHSRADRDSPAKKFWARAPGSVNFHSHCKSACTGRCRFARAAFRNATALHRPPGGFIWLAPC